MIKIKVVCKTCGGIGFVEETEWYRRNKVNVVCPTCNGEGYVMAKRRN